jgi:hypothetical protein
MARLVLESITSSASCASKNLRRWPITEMDSNMNHPPFAHELALNLDSYSPRHRSAHFSSKSGLGAAVISSTLSLAA